MNTNGSGRLPADLTDQQILGAVRARMGEVEELIPAPPDWRDRPAFAAPSRIRVTSRFRLGGTPLAIVAIAVVVALGLGLRQYVVSGPAAGNDGRWTQLTYRASSPALASVLAEIMGFRLGMRDFSIGTKGDEILIGLPPGTDIAGIRTVLEDPGRSIEIVLLTSSTYGTAAAPGRTAPPKPGERIDASLPVAFTGAQIAPTIAWVAIPSISLAPSASPVAPAGVDVIFLDSVQSAAKTWAAGHAGEYVAFVVDGIVSSIATVTVPPSQDAWYYLNFGLDLTGSEIESLKAVVSVGELPGPVTFVGMESIEGQNGAPVTQPPAGQVAAPSGSGGGASTPAYIQGSATAPVTLDVWLDYQCSNCKTFHDQVLPAILAEYVSSGKVKIAFHDYIVIDGNAGGTESLDAANAARCAVDQGKYEAYRDLLFTSQGAEGSGAFTKARLVDLGVQLGLDQATFASCVNSGARDADVAADSAAAGTRGLVGVPSVAVDGQLLNTYDIGSIRQAIDAALSRTQTPLPSPGVRATP